MTNHPLWILCPGNERRKKREVRRFVAVARVRVQHQEEELGLFLAIWCRSQRLLLTCKWVCVFARFWHAGSSGKISGSYSEEVWWEFWPGHQVIGCANELKIIYCCKLIGHFRMNEYHHIIYFRHALFYSMAFGLLSLEQKWVPEDLSGGRSAAHVQGWELPNWTDCVDSVGSLTTHNLRGLDDFFNYILFSLLLCFFWFIIKSKVM
jgi:hypothetical protein